MNFTSIDFETATNYHICAVGIVCVEKGKIINEFSSLIQPPNNKYNWHNIQVHGIYPENTINAPFFDKIYPKIKQLLQGKIIVAHNESFDRNVLKKTMTDYGINYSDLNIPNRWECTLKIYRTKGFQPANLAACCRQMDIQLSHHEALSDARACAMLYLKQ